jgi:hypothetical protein
MILHGKLGEDWDVFYYDAPLKFELIVIKVRLGFYLVENEKLVLPLLVLDKILAANDSQPLFIH